MTINGNAGFGYISAVARRFYQYRQFLDQVDEITEDAADKGVNDSDDDN